MQTSSRTLGVEKLVAALSALPLLQETVFHSVRFQDKKKEKEVCDVLLVHRKRAILLSIKAQETSRDLPRAQRWLKKHAPKAVAQIGGAYRTLRERNTWCTHAALGRVDFLPGEISAVHGVALLESSDEVVVDIEDSCLRKADGVTPVSLMSIADFLNVVHYLRTWRDLLRYLNGRHVALRAEDRRTIGAEPALLGYYTCMRDTFDGCASIGDAKIVTANGKHVRDGSAFRDREVGLAAILEDVMRGTSTAAEMDLPMDGAFLRPFMSSPATARDLVQDDLTELNIQERALIGEQIGHLCQRMVEENPSDPLYTTARFTRSPDKVYVIILGRDADDRDLGLQAIDLTIAACVHYGRPTGVTLLLNEKGNNLKLHFGYMQNVQPSLEMIEAGREYFGHIRPRKILLAR